MSAAALPSAVVFTIIMTLMPPVDLHGQAIAPGTKLRWKERNIWVRGDVTDSANVKLISRNARQAIPWDNPSLEHQVRGGRRNHGAVIGFGAGALGGALLGFASGDDECGTGQWCILTWTASEKAVAGAIILGPLGALIGALASPGAQWASVAGQRTARVRPHIDHRMVGFRATF